LSAEEWNKLRETELKMLLDCQEENKQLKQELSKYENAFQLIKLAGGKEVQLALKLEAIRQIVKQNDWIKLELGGTAFYNELLEVLSG